VSTIAALDRTNAALNCPSHRPDTFGDTVALLMADQAFPGGPESAVAKIGVLIGSLLAAVIGAAVLATGAQTQATSSYEAARASG
jgi:NhaA family Na+:H+ antiporter